MSLPLLLPHPTPTLPLLHPPPPPPPLDGRGKDGEGGGEMWGVEIESGDSQGGEEHLLHPHLPLSLHSHLPPRCPTPPEYPGPPPPSTYTYPPPSLSSPPSSSLHLLTPASVVPHTYLQTPTHLCVSILPVPAPRKVLPAHVPHTPSCPWDEGHARLSAGQSRFDGYSPAHSHTRSRNQTQTASGGNWQLISAV